MAKRRCFAIDFYHKEEFLDLSNGAKVLYLGLLLSSDDEGVVINHRTTMRIIGATETDLRELSETGLLIKINDVYIIRHWYMHNKVQPTRIVKSLYQEELSRLYITQTKEYELID